MGVRCTFWWLLLGALSPAVALAQTPRKDVLLAGSPVDGSRPAVASAGDLSAACWNDSVTENVYVSTSDENGLSWSPPVRVDAGPALAGRKTEIWGLAVLGDSVYVAWKDERAGGPLDAVFLNVSNNRGATWIGERRVPDGYPAGVGGIRDWRMQVEAGAPSNRVYFLMAVEPAPGVDDELWFVSSSNGGVSFGTPINPSSLSHGLADVDEIDLQASGLDLYATWHDSRFGAKDEVFFQKSADGGVSWLVSDLIVSDSLDALGADDDLALAVNGSVVAVAMQEETGVLVPEELRINVSTNAGGSFGGAIKVGSYVSGTHDVALDPGSLLVLDDGTIVVAWPDDRLGTNNVYVSRSTTGGASWAPDLKLSVTGGNSPRIAAQGTRVALTWFDGVGVDEAGATFSSDSGATWAPTFFVNDTLNGGDVDDPHVAANANGNFIHVWLEAPTATTDDVVAGGYTLCPEGTPPASATFRNGTGVNPASYTSVNPPILGQSWQVNLDCTGYTPSFAFVVVKTSALAGVNTSFGQLLMTGPTLLSLSKPHGGGVAAFSTAVPNSPSLCGLCAPSQGLCLGVPGPQLSNALDLCLGL